MSKSTELWYRYEDRMSWSFDLEPFVEVVERSYPVAKRTPCGVWLGTGRGTKRFALNQARKRFAYPTVEEALTSFLARKRSQINIVEGQLKRARRALAIAEAIASAVPNRASD